MLADPPRINQIELEPVHVKGELVLDNWWRVAEPLGKTSLRKRFGMEMLTLALPLAVGLIYQLVIAAPRFVSESEFMGTA